MVLTEQLWDDVHRLSPQKHVAFLGVFVASHSVLAARVRLFRIHTIATHIVVLRQQRTYISNLFIHSFIIHSFIIIIVIIITHWRHCYRGRCSGEPSSGQQNRQISWTGQHAHLLPSCHRNRRYLESLGCWARSGNWQTGHIIHWRTQRIHIYVSAVVNSPPKGKCGRPPRHFWLWSYAVAVTPCLVKCLKPVVLC